MFIFNRPFAAVAAGLGIALFLVCLDHVSDASGSGPEPQGVVNMTRALVPQPAPGVSSAPVRDLSLSCRLPPASFASRLPSLKSRIVPDQVAARAPSTQRIVGQHSC
jgi:hypothetical protein